MLKYITYTSTYIQFNFALYTVYYINFICFTRYSSYKKIHVSRLFYHFIIGYIVWFLGNWFWQLLDYDIIKSRIQKYFFQISSIWMVYLGRSINCQFSIQKHILSHLLSQRSNPYIRGNYWGLSGDDVRRNGLAPIL